MEAALEAVADREAGELLDAVDAEHAVVAGRAAAFIAGDRRTEQPLYWT